MTSILRVAFRSDNERMEATESMHQIPIFSNIV